MRTLRISPRSRASASRIETQHAPGSWITATEVARREASRARPYQRYHYRWVAADLAEQAANLVPARSQAFAATLCHASRWLRNDDVPTSQAYYQRYLRQGPYVPWATGFGMECPEPDFTAARVLARRQHWQQARSTLRPCCCDKQLGHR